MSPLGKLFPEENIESSDHIGVGVKITVFIMETRVFKWKIDNCPREVHTKLHPGLEYRIFHILSSEDIDDVIYLIFLFVFNLLMASDKVRKVI